MVGEFLAKGFKTTEIIRYSKPLYGYKMTINFTIHPVHPLSKLPIIEVTDKKHNKCTYHIVYKTQPCGIDFVVVIVILFIIVVIFRSYGDGGGYGNYGPRRAVGVVASGHPSLFIYSVSFFFIWSSKALGIVKE